MAINAGRLRKVISVYRYEESENSVGSTVTRLIPVKKLYGEIRPVRGSEYTEYYKEYHTLSVKITLRFWEGLKPSDILVYKDRQFIIQSIINPLEENYIVECMCTEKREKEIAYE